jgi:hypothetical protein
VVVGALDYRIALVTEFRPNHAGRKGARAANLTSRLLLLLMTAG